MSSSNRNDRRNLVLDAFIQHERALRRYISRFVRKRHDIEDVAQEAFLRAYRVEQDHDIEQPKSFLFRIAHNIAVTELRRKSSQIVDYIEDIDPSNVLSNGSSAEDEAVAKQSLGIHCEAVAQLPEQCRRVYLLRKVHGLTHKEISEYLNISVSTVEKHLAKGVRLCARYIEAAEQVGSETVPDDATKIARMSEKN